MSEKIIINVASFKRTESLIKSLQSVINQCDEINVALNDHYDEEIPQFLFHPKINLFLTDNSLGDAFKFLNLENSDGYFFTIDDDLIYPKTYVSDTIKKCKEFNNKKVITYHGRSFGSFPIASYYKSANERYACLQRVKQDVKVQFGGTGVMCFHTSLLKIPINYFELPNMADVWVGKFCIENNIEIICLKHEEGYIKYIPQKTTIYDEESKSDRKQTEIVNGIFIKEQIIKTEEKKQEKKDEKYQMLFEKTHKQINYNKINSIFKINNPHIQKTEHNVKTNNIKLNSSTISKFSSKKRK